MIREVDMQTGRRSGSVVDDDRLEEIRDRIVEHLAKADHAVVNVLASVSLNQVLRGVAALIGPCSLIRLEDEPLGPKSLQKLTDAFSMNQPVVLGCRPTQNLPVELAVQYGFIYKSGWAGTKIPYFSLPKHLGFQVEDPNGGLRDLVLLILNTDNSPTPDEYRSSLVYTLLGKHEAADLVEVGREDDSAVQRVGKS